MLDATITIRTTPPICASLNGLTNGRHVLLLCLTSMCRSLLMATRSMTSTTCRWRLETWTIGSTLLLRSPWTLRLPSQILTVTNLFFPRLLVRTTFTSLACACKAEFFHHFYVRAKAHAPSHTPTSPQTLPSYPHALLFFECTCFMLRRKTGLPPLAGQIFLLVPLNELL